MIGPVYNTSINSSNTTMKEASEEIVSSLFSNVLNSMYNSELFSDNTLIKKSTTEKWFREMLNAEYAKTATKKELKPLVDQILKSFNSIER
ncbi:rod-binding protein [Oceanotoga sp. DSM 15011]|jgi:hypothetical protein|uniref:Rod binding protein n=1 Tax=Oceanotoga teriensis TaxID=515440 RepID=A0AA45C8F0_9BACT|nr:MULTISPECIES: rod-binding protein [Oceanotoga]MDN5342449.1 rRNA (adenine-N6)-dimethyltransferase [Oceanotoga sp.]MDO7975598.1 rod-binding protein [Oceanotoga teriensis]PWJ96113.1 rod binding protein [Oceanotoga teriensis]UYO99895.1 rod-binding protein [Oceanotoga sp. DSM 15011]